MNYSDTQLMEEINAMLNELAGERKPWNATYIANEICGKHMDGLSDSDESAFWLHTSYSDTRRKVTHAINRRAGDNVERKDDHQVELLPGYEHLHNYYVVKRDDEEVGIQVYEMTDVEIQLKAAMYRRMGAACYAHAAELDRFLNTREAVT